MYAIVTGASQGIGYETAKQLAKCGHQVIAIARNERKLAELATSTPGITPIPFDLTTLRDVKARETLLQQISAATPRIDLLINNAGALTVKPFMESTWSDFEQAMNLNVFSVVALTQLLVPLMGGQTSSHVVNISSVGACEAKSKFPGLATYTTSKAALNAVSQFMALELKAKNITCNTLALGAVETDMLHQAFPHFKAQVTAVQMGQFIAHFALTGHPLCDGQLLVIDKGF